MTEVRFACAGGKLFFGAEGHVGDGGENVGGAGVKAGTVCAAVSILCHTLAQTVRYFEAEGKTDGSAEIRLAPGSCALSVVPKPEHFAEALHAFFVVQTGFSLLARSFTDRVSLVMLGAEGE